MSQDFLDLALIDACEGITRIANLRARGVQAGDPEMAWPEQSFLKAAEAVKGRFWIPEVKQ